MTSLSFTNRHTLQSKAKKVKIANCHAKIIIKMYFKHYFYISYGIKHSLCGILLPK